ncbi:MAG: cell division protein FtsA [Proteobacteria bacterium]|nr:cell division protein FtsA [Pseudomonadota bacterium]
MGETFRLRTNGAKPVSVRGGLIAALDVGSSKVVCIIGRAEGESLRVLGAALHESQGIRSGAVTGLDLAEQSIREAVASAEQLADQRIQDVILSVQCGQPKSLTACVERDIGGALVNDSDLRELIGEGKARCRQEGFETIQCAPTSYAVDRLRGVRNPSGMFCERLGIAVHGVAVRTGPLHNLRLAVERCHLSIACQLYSPYASALSTLTPDEMALGVTLIDLGAGVTSAAMFMEDALIHVDAVPLGGNHVTVDVARILSTPLAAAERMKSLYGSALGDLEVGTGTIEVPQMGEDGEAGGSRVRRSLLTKIIQSRMEEIFVEMRKCLTRSGFDMAAGRRIVLTGGGCQLAGVRELAGRILNKPVRLGRPQTFPGLPAATAGPAYATALGLLISGATMPSESHAPVSEVKGPQSGHRLVRWLSASLFG